MVYPVFLKDIWSITLKPTRDIYWNHKTQTVTCKWVILFEPVAFLSYYRSMESSIFDNQMSAWPFCRISEYIAALFAGTILDFQNPTLSTLRHLGIINLSIVDLSSLMIQMMLARWNQRGLIHSLSERSKNPVKNYNFQLHSIILRRLVDSIKANYSSFAFCWLEKDRK